MKAPTANLINAITLTVLSTWSFIAIGMASTTALIPAVAGLMLLGCQSGVKEENKIIAHIAVVITLGIFLALIVPLVSAFGAVYEEPLALLRTALMMATCLLAFVAFIRSFIAARKARDGG
ncbi:MAG: hypothetical protein AAF965_08810 [Pseudomonadota bacterium]